MSDEQKRNHEWTAKQQLFMEWLALPSRERVPLTEKMLADELGVTDRTLRNWQKLPGFQEDLHDLIRANLGDALSEVTGSFKDEAKKGSFQHQKMYYEMVGWYVNKVAPVTPDGKDEYTGGIDAKAVLLDRLMRVATRSGSSGDSEPD